MKKQLSQEQPLILKILFLGQSNVGKTSLIYRQADGIYQEKFTSTIGVDFKIKQYQVSGLNIKAQLWDTSLSGGGQRFKTIAKCYLRGKQAAIICFDLNNYQSFTYVQSWLQQVKLYAQMCQIFLVGCKSDLEHKVSQQEIMKFSLLHGIVYFQTSAKEGKGVNQFMQAVIGIAIPKKLQQMKTTSSILLNHNNKDKDNQGGIC